MATKATAKGGTPAAAPALETGPQEAYCMKCREKRPMVDATEVTMKNGRPALQSTCPVCGTTLNKILPSKK